MIESTTPGIGELELPAVDAEEMDRILAEGATLPALFYTDPEIARLEDDLIFRRSWQYICAELELTKPGDYVTASLYGTYFEVPVVIVRGQDMELRAFINVCRHRAHFVATGRGNRKTLQCTYHGWTYGLDGCLRAVPRQQEGGLPPFETLGLYPLAVDTWAGFVFVAIDPQEPLMAALGELPEILEREGYDFPFVGEKGLVPREPSELPCASNWKVFLENAVECYHCPTTHTNSFSDFFCVDDRYQHVNYDRGCYHVAPFAPKVAERWSDATAEHEGGDFQFYFLWPNMFFIGGVRGGRAGMTRVVPVGPRDSKFVTRSYTRPAENEEYVAAFDAMLDETLREDIAVCERVQTGLRSGLYQWGYTLPKSEQNMRHIYRMVWETLSPAFR